MFSITPPVGGTTPRAPPEVGTFGRLLPSLVKAMEEAASGRQAASLVAGAVQVIELVESGSRRWWWCRSPDRSDAAPRPARRRRPAHRLAARGCDPDPDRRNRLRAVASGPDGDFTEAIVRPRRSPTPITTPVIWSTLPTPTGLPVTAAPGAEAAAGLAVDVTGRLDFGDGGEAVRAAGWRVEAKGSIRPGHARKVHRRTGGVRPGQADRHIGDADLARVADTVVIGVDIDEACQAARGPMLSKL